MALRRPTSCSAPEFLPLYASLYKLEITLFDLDAYLARFPLADASLNDRLRNIVSVLGSSDKAALIPQPGINIMPLLELRRVPENLPFNFYFDYNTRRHTNAHALDLTLDVRYNAT
jgi:hypothetical protein